MVASEIARHAQDLLDFIDASPSPWHAVAAMEQRLHEKGFTRLEESETWDLRAEGRYYVIRGGSSLIAFILGSKPLTEGGFRIVGAHTDSPGLRLKPQPAHRTETMMRLAVEVYGGPILATFSDRDLSLAGRIYVRNDSSLNSFLIRFEQPLLRLANLAIHMNRSVNEDGLKFNKQNELPLLLCGLCDNESVEQKFLDLLTEKAKCNANDILSWDLNVYDTQKGSFWGPELEFIADSQLDNLSSCYAGLVALLETEAPESTCVGAFFDHEEIGSESNRGAMGSFISDVLERLAYATDANAPGYKQALSCSFMISADAAHAYHPNFPNAYEPLHRIAVNRGPAIKINANQRYATDSMTEAKFIELCRQADVPYQKYSHRSDLACGSTIGPMTAARLGIPTVDVGCPLWAMHSIRESAGVLDQAHLLKVLKTFFAVPVGQII
ncbi:M18 family aminopeptidase [Methylocaldum szegediense]|uniref:M18 family aminopeptidase n=1 Tax=Methylocaldum szegediense TaxID=73780 RepID=A0ABM9I551_9GAMM|nr:M18 family aminopeptidase [Methylocaldum szegediense]CAI8898762.1 putative M18 family aminopeptidase 2 [Methylocaldum szegediense]